jgi:hypothetical protein
MKGIGYITGQRIRYESNQFWSMERSIPYRIIGAVFLLIGVAPLLIVLKHSPPWWFYILPLSLLIPGIVIITFSEGIYIDKRIHSLIQWFKVLGLGRKRTIQFSELKGVSIKERVTKSTTSGSLVFDVLLFGEKGSLKVYRASSEDEAIKHAARISALTGLPRKQPPSKQLSTRTLIIIVVSALLLPILMLGLFLIIRAMV